MKCTQCGYENEKYFAFCPRCGQKAACETAEVLPQNTVTTKVLCAFKDVLFLALCITMTACGALKLLTQEGIPLFEVLFSIFLWLCFAAAKNDTVNFSYIRNLSGTVYAMYILYYVSCGLAVVFGFTINAVFDALPFELSDYIYESIDMISDFLIIISLIFAVVIFLVNFFVIRNLHQFVKSVYESVEFQKDIIVYANFACICLLVFGIISVLSAFAFLSSISLFLTSVLSGGCSILASMLIKKHLL